MAKLRHYYNGISVYKPTGTHKRTDTKRSKTKGWTSSATNRNKKFLQSVNINLLDGFGLAITLTLKDCPETPEQWHKVRDNFQKRLSRKGLMRYHWVTEWQKRGVPHLHMSAYFQKHPDNSLIRQIKRDWCEVAANYRPLQKSQHVAHITSIKGWLEYSAKHGARGMFHYQRSNPPPEWQESTGRVWGKGGDWPQVQVDTVLFTDQFYRFRRLVRKWRISDARQPEKNLVHVYMDGTTRPFNNSDYKEVGLNYFNLPRNKKRITAARKILKKPNRKLSEVAGLSEWIPLDLQTRMLEYIIQHEGLPAQNIQEA